MSAKTLAAEAERVISKDAVVVVVVEEMVSKLRRHVDTPSEGWLGTACFSCITVSRWNFFESDKDGLVALFFDTAALIDWRLLFARVLHGVCADLERVCAHIPMRVWVRWSLQDRDCQRGT